MRIAFGSDERTALTDHLVEELQARGHRVSLLGPPAGDGAPEAGMQWAEVGQRAAMAVAQGDADEAVICCWTGTGVSIAANRVPGVRAALCSDAETARGARRWNDANALCLSLRTTTEALAREILDAWFAGETLDPGERQNVARLEGRDGGA
ncbi:MAG: RpiB/LacA/LacB family sugar-phosphate isomerase [Chloroflexi bacterium]|nr:RpiB/LacA/LacB family sugar-phosphate isomerase [Chloroflexota bacterium]